MSSSTIVICSESTKDGKPCRGRAMKGKSLCPIHYKASIGEPITRKKKPKSLSSTKSPRNMPSSLPDYLLEISEAPKSPKRIKSAFVASVNMDTELSQSPPTPEEAKKSSPHKEAVKVQDDKPKSISKIVVDAKSPRRRTVKSMSEMRRLMSPRRKRIGLK